MKIISAVAVVALAVVGCCTLSVVLDAEPVNPFQAFSKETDFIRSGEQTNHIRASEPTK